MNQTEEIKKLKKAVEVLEISVKYNRKRIENTENYIKDCNKIIKQRRK